jgi:two-component system nitrogen regulation response regulator GlnG
MPTLLIVDDERNVLYSLERGLHTEGLRIVRADTARAGIDAVRDERPDAVLLDVQLPDLSGLDAFVRMREVEPKLPVILMTAHGTAETAIEAMKRGAFDYILKPWKLADLKSLVARALDASRLSRVPALFAEEAGDAEGPQVDRIVGRSPAMQAVYKEIGRIAGQDVNVLILGESGAGKELVARAIYRHSRRADGPFLAINCAAIPETLLESELFGHEKGAFTGADRRRIGKFEQADGGTLFLDEIGDMSPATQSRVLRVLQDGRFERVGGNETLQADVRVIAATNKDLERALAAREFRQDLLYRLNTFTLRLPPLRDRMDDLPLLVEHFLRQCRRELGRDVRGISAEALELLRAHSWPGNVRELQGAIRFAAVHAAGDVLNPGDLPPPVRGDAPPAISVPLAPAQETSFPDVRAFVRRLLNQHTTGVHDQVHGAIDQVLIEEVLVSVDGSQSRAAEVLGISRTTLRGRMQQLGISVEKVVREQGTAGDGASD